VFPPGPGADKSPGVRAAKAWHGDEFRGRKGEESDPYFELCFRHSDALDAEFEELAVRIFGPLLSHAQEVKA